MTAPDVSVIVEWENAAWAGERRAHDALARLAEEVRLSRRPIEVLLCHDADPAPDLPLQEDDSHAPWRAVRVPDARYYELKNHGARAAAGHIVVFLDSDAIPEPGWLDALLAPFGDAAVDVVAGHAYIQADSFYGKAFALWWFFPLRSDPAPLEPVTHFFANNVAFRRGTILAHPFRATEGTSRGACLELAAALGRAGITIWKTAAAQVAHPPPRGWRHFALRALAQGRDRLAREAGWKATPVGSAARLLRNAAACAARTLRGHARVGLPAAGLPAAILLGWAYYALCFAGELAALARVPAVRRIRI